MDNKGIKRLSHVSAHVAAAFNKDGQIDNIVKGKGNLSSSAAGLSANAFANAVFSWFHNCNLSDFKNWMFVASILDRLYYKYQELNPDWGRGFPELIKPLLSDNEDVIEWIANYELAFDLKRIVDPTTPDFIAYLPIVALRKDWERLRASCELIFSNPKLEIKHKDRVLDLLFFHALAKGDEEKMQGVIAEIVSETSISMRNKYESGYTKDLICTDAVVYAKLGWRNGYPLRIESSYVPTAWLPIEPLKNYDRVYDFL